MSEAGARTNLLNQLHRRRLAGLRSSGPVEATILGNVLVQARGAGELGSLADLRSIVRASCDLKTYEPREPDRWAAAYPRFVDLMAKSAADSAI